MSSRRAAAAAALPARILTAAVGRRLWSKGGLEAVSRRAFSWPSAKASYNRPGFFAPPSPWTSHQHTQEQYFPWSLQEMHKHPFLFTDSEEDDLEDFEMDVAETRKILMHVNAVALKKRLKSDSRDSFSYKELLDVIKEAGLVVNDEEARRYARALDEAGVVLIFRENVYLHPERVAKLVANALPFAVVSPDDPRRSELMKLEAVKAEIDELANRQVRKYLWTGLFALSCQAALFFRLTFWELSWDVMEPIAFFVTSAGLIAGYTYFLVTARDPSYQDLRQRLFLSRQLKLYKKKKFDYLRYQLLRRQCQCLDPEQ